MLDSSTYYKSRRLYRRRDVTLEWLEVAAALLGGIAIAGLIILLSGPGTATEFMFLG